MIAEAELGAMVERQLRELLADPSVRQSVIGGQGFTAEHRDQLENVSAQVGSMLADRSLGAVMNGPLWLSGASILNGTVNADKLVVNTLESVTTNTGTLNVTGNITAAASFPAVAARIVVNSSGLYGYQSDGVTTTFKLNVDGSGEIGSGANKISWTNAGVLAIPAAVITSLTIANINTGIMGGTYTTSAGTAKISISPTGITATDSLGNTTFSLNATTGAMTATGSFTVQSASSGTRVVISSAGGIEGYNGVTQTFLLNAATGAGQLGPTAGGNYISWSSTGVTIGGVAMSGGKITASALSVTTLSSLTANLGTITAGTLTASVISGGTLNAAGITVTNLSATSITTGSLNGTLLTAGTVSDSAVASLSANKITAGSGIINALTVANTLTLGTGGKIIDGDGSFWDQTGIVLTSAGSSGDSIKWRTAGVDKGSIWCNSTQITFGYGTGSSNEGVVLLAATTAILGSGTAKLHVEGGFGTASGGRFYPGAGTGTVQGSYYVEGGAVGAIITNGIGIGGMLGISSGNTINLVSPGTGGSATNWSGFTTANIPDKSAGYFLIQIAGTNYRVPFYANA